MPREFNAGTINIPITSDASRLIGEARRAERSMRRLGHGANDLSRDARRLNRSSDLASRGLRQMGRNALFALNPIGRLTSALGVLVGATGLGVAGTRAIDFGFNLARAAEGVDLTATEMLRLRFGLQATGGEISQAATGLRALHRRTGEARQGFGELRNTLIQLDEFQLLSDIINTDEFNARVDVVLSRLAEIDDRSRRIAVASAAFDVEPGLAIARYAEEFEELNALAERVGLTFDEDLARAASDLATQLNAMSLVFRSAFSQAVLRNSEELGRIFDALIRSIDEVVSAASLVGSSIVDAVDSAVGAFERLIRWIEVVSAVINARFGGDGGLPGQSPFSNLFLDVIRAIPQAVAEEFQEMLDFINRLTGGSPEAFVANELEAAAERLRQANDALARRNESGPPPQGVPDPLEDLVENVNEAAAAYDRLRLVQEGLFLENARSDEGPEVARWRLVIKTIEEAIERRRAFERQKAVGFQLDELSDETLAVHDLRLRQIAVRLTLDEQINRNIEKRKSLEEAAALAKEIAEGRVRAAEIASRKAIEETNRLLRERQREYEALVSNAEGLFSSFFDSLIRGTESVIDAVKRLVAELLIAATRMAVLDPLSRGLASAFTGFIHGPPPPAGPGTVDTIPPARQHGGPVFAGQRYTVGEAGPEIFTPGMSGRITPLGGGEPPVVVNQYIYSHDGPAIDRAIQQATPGIVAAALSAREAQVSRPGPLRRRGR